MSRYGRRLGACDATGSARRSACRRGAVGVARDGGRLVGPVLRTALLDRRGAHGEDAGVELLDELELDRDRPHERVTLLLGVLAQVARQLLGQGVRVLG